MQVESNKLLVDLLVEGDEKAFDVLFRQVYPKMRLFLSRLCGDDDAEDIIQDLFLKLWLNHDKIKSIGNLDSYLFRASRNAALTLIRNAKWSAVLNEQKAEDNLKVDTSPVDDAMCSQLEQIIEQELEKMPPQRREIFRMSRFQGMSNEQIAKAKNLSKRTVETHISLALAELRNALPDILFLIFINSF